MSSTEATPRAIRHRRRAASSAASFPALPPARLPAPTATTLQRATAVSIPSPVQQEKCERGPLEETSTSTSSASACTSSITSPSLAESACPTSPSLQKKRMLECEADEDEKKRSKKRTVSTLHPRPKGYQHIQPKEAPTPPLYSKLEEIEHRFSLELQDLPDGSLEEAEQPAAFTPLHLLLAEANPPDINVIHQDDHLLLIPGNNTTNDQGPGQAFLFNTWLEPTVLFTDEEDIFGLADEEQLTRDLLCLIDRCGLDEVLKMEIEEVQASLLLMPCEIKAGFPLLHDPPLPNLKPSADERSFDEDFAAEQETFFFNEQASDKEHTTVPALHHHPHPRHLQHLRAEDVQACKDVVDGYLQQDEEHMEEGNDIFLSFLDLDQ